MIEKHCLAEQGFKRTCTPPNTKKDKTGYVV